jgi:hypothetical protein
MDFITVFIIGLVIYSLIKNVKKRFESRNPMSGREIFTGGDSLTQIKEMLKQYKEIQNPEQAWELEQKIKYGRRPAGLSTEKKAGVERVWAETAVSGTEGTSGSEGTQGSEGTFGYEGTWGIEGTSGYEGAQGTEGTTGSEGIPGIEGIPGNEGYWSKGIPGEGIASIKPVPPKEAVGFFDPDFHLDEQELQKGIIWAEVLGLPRALRPYRTRR